jgi:flagellar basal-body rod protein FlgB
MSGMDLTQIPLFAMLRGRLGYLSDRQQVISQNVANSDTPGFQPKDLKPFTFDAQVSAESAAREPVMTDPGHMQPHGRTGAGSGFNPVVSRDSETRLDGNSVVLEEEMMKLTDARMSYQAAISFYEHSLNLLKIAAKPPGK